MEALQKRMVRLRCVKLLFESMLGAVCRRLIRLWLLILQGDQGAIFGEERVVADDNIQVSNGLSSLTAWNVLNGDPARWVGAF